MLDFRYTKDASPRELESFFPIETSKIIGGPNKNNITLCFYLRGVINNLRCGYYESVELNDIRFSSLPHKFSTGTN